MLLLVGLGNPGAAYTKNRHNIGFMAVDEIVRRHSFATYRARFHGLVAAGSVAGARLLALKPKTFVNDSGRSVAAAMRYHRLGVRDLIVLHDDLDLKPGKVRVKRGGGHAGHKGLRNIDAHIGRDYLRVRIGIGHPGEKTRVTGYVLRNFTKADRPWVEATVGAVAEALPLLITGDESGFMNKVTLTRAPPRQAMEKKKAEAAIRPAEEP
ncbi:MAG: aminoacyl-tRNA hydrolase [Alphaproteobacteria bacterium]